ncbi:potassium-transporting ATPase subunit KdpB [Streptomyces caniscabiei]|uniref:Potassium-transporting ATPase ATP-binding subunit n=1 Tax=Streptomyces caniscabiei TaxID=2746961 RepID=A0ABU4MTI6_9ACTN|nr:potassium-transporting ATPase subunit KdpB [Streptomyces caniscabiei]MBE4737509.1 potassium-transporting ATPase subunit KdpB [Streptomyces caniscabiei]MBE4756269.1 potassium-transporting ATPase subunit KdpB [Streptomyces caniscabiei]MBE4769714.1 potassium-transporting ATPase subunit KdpB [Streptomyces caniscabiei]MBE4787340.1 potassium-transporting ATPase subunit KdpB [Streptomyces caniscabiei]MBE4795255.1 potassium-transporting ATPase subunit KdpB [Streptomyces caniscabiei]
MTTDTTKHEDTMSTTTPTRAPHSDVSTGHKPADGRVGAGLFDPALLLTSLPDAFRKLDPRVMVKSPVMFVVLVGSALTTVFSCTDPTDWFGWTISAWLWLTVIFANLAEAVAEGRGRAQADTLRRARTGAVARRLLGDAEERVPGTELRIGDLVVCEAGDIVPGDGDVVEGVASVDESAITGESAPVIRESGGDRSAVTGGTKVLSDRIVVKITTKPGETFIDRMISLVEGAARQKTPNEIALDILLASLTVVFLLAVATLPPFADYAGTHLTMVVLVALLVCLIPTTIGALLSAIGIAGMDRLVQRNVLAMSGRAVEAAGDVSTLLLDKTGTITFGNRQAAEFVPVSGTTEAELADAAQLSSLADETPEGRSVVVLAKERYGLRERHQGEFVGAEWIAFTARTRMSGVDVDGRGIRKGAAGSVLAWVRERGGTIDEDAGATADRISEAGGTPLLVAVEDDRGARVLGVIHLKDVVKDGMRERFEELRRMGIRTIMITGDNPLTARAIAEEAGVDDFLAEATPEDKMALIKREQAGGKLVAMTGDGTNDAPALAQADVGVAMNTGTSAAKEAGNMVDLDSDPTKLIEIVGIGKQLLITRGALTTFSIANDVAKYFAIIPALFAAVHPGLDKLNIMGLSSPDSAILSAVVFNALIIVALVPLSLKGVRYRPVSADRMLRRNLTVYGLGGLIAPFIGIKLIDLLVSLIPGIG